MFPRGRPMLALALLAPLAVAAPAPAAITTARDAAGRTITFDVRAPGADVRGYRDVLSRSVHGDEIRQVTVRVVAPSRIRAACRDPRAVACYSRGPAGSIITIPARPARRVQGTLLHEYGHHIDATIDTPRWWRARGMTARLNRGQVARDYSKGWSRSVGEVFAEDYVALHVRGISAIRWLRPASESVLRALRRDITGRPGGLPPVAADPATDPTVPVGGDVLSRMLRSGTVGAGQVLEAAVALDAPDRHVTVAVRPDPSRAEVPVHIDVACDGMAPATYDAGAGEVAYVQVGPIGPGTCTARVSGPADRAGGVSLELVVAASPAVTAAR